MNWSETFIYDPKITAANRSINQIIPVSIALPPPPAPTLQNPRSFSLELQNPKPEIKLKCQSSRKEYKQGEKTTRKAKFTKEMTEKLEYVYNSHGHNVPHIEGKCEPGTIVQNGATGLKLVS